MTGLDERLKDDGLRLVERAQAVADTEDALAELNDEIEVPITGGGRRAFAGIAAAGLLVIVGVATFAVLRREPAESVSFGLPVAPGAPATSTAPVTLPALTLPSTSPPLVTDPPSQTQTSTATEQPTTVATTDDVFPPGRPCTYTDPAQRSITVARALKCADGTKVWVNGHLVTTPDGEHYLCGKVSADAATPCDGAGLHLVGLVGKCCEYIGTKHGEDLLVSPIASSLGGDLQSADRDVAGMALRCLKWSLRGR